MWLIKLSKNHFPLNLNHLIFDEPRFCYSFKLDLFLFWNDSKPYIRFVFLVVFIAHFCFKYKSQSEFQSVIIETGQYDVEKINMRIEQSAVKFMAVIVWNIRNILYKRAMSLAAILVKIYSLFIWKGNTRLFTVYLNLCMAYGFPNLTKNIFQSITAKNRTDECSFSVFFCMKFFE